MPIGIPADQDQQICGFPTWFIPLVQQFESLEQAPYTSIRSTSWKTDWIMQGKAFYFETSQLPEYLTGGDFSDEKRRVAFQVQIRQLMLRWGYTQEHYQISFLQKHQKDYRIKNSPRTCFIIKTRSKDDPMWETVQRSLPSGPRPSMGHLSSAFPPPQLVAAV